VKRRYVVLLVAGLVLAAPAGASAHGRSATVALDYRLVLDDASRALPGVSASILDGDRQLKLDVERSLVVVGGDLGEPMLRLTTAGAWANRASVTAVAEKIATPGKGWVQVARGSSFTWHEHRLAPPPYDGGKAGPVATFRIPVTVDGRPGAIGGTFVRYTRPSVWPWVAAAVVLAVALAWALRARPASRGTLITILGALAGFAGLAALAIFGAADAPNGRVAWAQLVLAAVIASVVYGALVRLRGIRRVHLAGFIGLAAALVTLSYASVFWHGVVISLLSATTTRLLLLAGLVTGAVAAVSSLRYEAPR
jgi:hypothetical protein